MMKRMISASLSLVALVFSSLPAIAEVCRPGAAPCDQTSQTTPPRFIATPSPI